MCGFKALYDGDSTYYGSHALTSRDIDPVIRNSTLVIYGFILVYLSYTLGLMLGAFIQWFSHHNKFSGYVENEQEPRNGEQLMNASHVQQGATIPADDFTGKSESIV